MAYSKTAIVSILIAMVFGGSVLYAQDVPIGPVQPPGSILSDTSDAVDTLQAADIDSIKVIADSTLTEDTLAYHVDSIPLYYHTNQLGKGYGDYLWFKSDVLPLQHGSIGQAEIITKSVMLPGLGIVYNGLPFFHQGKYFPFRSGADLNVLMFENIGFMDITSLDYLGLFNQGEVLSLQSSFWPSEASPSSVTIARGPYNYERAGWRFSRRFNEYAALTFTAGFKESSGLYGAGSDYDDFCVTGSFAYQPKPNAEFRYAFYQQKAKKGLLQFDRLINLMMRENHDQNYHTIEGKYLYDENLQFELDIYRQKNYSHLFGNDINYDFFLRDNIYGGKAAANYGRGIHNLRLETGAQKHHIVNTEADILIARLVTMGLILCDSISLTPEQNLVITSRLRHNNIDDFRLAASAKFGWRLNEKTDLSFAAGRLDYSPDIYSKYYSHPDIDSVDSEIITFYTYNPNHNLNSSRSHFINAKTKYDFNSSLSLVSGLTYEKVDNDIIPVTVDSSTVWHTTSKNIDYNRLTAAFDINYSITKYFKGSAGLTYFLYDPDEAAPNIKFTPAGMGRSTGMIKFTNVLRDIDISAFYQLRYLTAREYSGFITHESAEFFNIDQYDAVVVIDGSINIRFGSFEFKICEENILDFIIGNDYNVWGSYQMPPGMVWWQFTWNFLE